MDEWMQGQKIAVKIWVEVDLGELKMLFIWRVLDYLTTSNLA